MKITKLPRVLILILGTSSLQACSLLRVAGPCYGYGCPAATAHGEQKSAASGPAPAPAQVAAANTPSQNSDASSADSSAHTKSADASSHKHGLLAKLHLTHGD